MNASLKRSLRGAMLLGVLLVPAALVISAERRTNDRSRESAPSTTVEMFAAIDAKEIDVKLIPKDDTEARVIIKNNTGKPLTVKLPEAFAAMPVLAQRGGLGAGRGGGGGGANGQQGGQQTGGGGMGGGGGMMGGMGMMNVAADKPAQFKVGIVCLEHGKKDPRPAVPYEIKPIESFSSKPELKEMLTAFGKQKMNQKAAQAAAWHLSNDMSWEQLAGKRIEHLDGSSDPYFSPEEIQVGMRIAGQAVTQAQEKATKSPGESRSPGLSVNKTESANDR